MKPNSGVLLVSALCLLATGLTGAPGSRHASASMIAPPSQPIAAVAPTPHPDTTPGPAPKPSKRPRLRIAPTPPPLPPPPADLEAPPVLFDLDSAEIGPQYAKVLEPFAEVVAAHIQLVLRLRGHTCSIGSEAHNMKLSEQRARAVASFLNEHGVPWNRMRLEWYGETKPVADNATSDGRSQNRRVVIEILDKTDMST
jgi:OOP family OmpA-OmpF porin